MGGATEGESCAASAGEIKNPDVSLGISHCDRQTLSIRGKAATAFVESPVGNLIENLSMAVEPEQVRAKGFRSRLIHQQPILADAKCGVPSAGIVFHQVRNRYGIA